MKTLIVIENNPSSIAKASIPLFLFLKFSVLFFAKSQTIVTPRINPKDTDLVSSKKLMLIFIYPC